MTDKKISHSLVDDYEETEAGAQGLAAASLAAQVGNLLDEALESSGLDQRTLAAKIGVTEGRVSQVLNGDGNLRAAAFARYMRAMGYDVHLSATPVDESKPNLPKPRRRMPQRRRRPDLAPVPGGTSPTADLSGNLKQIFAALRAAPNAGSRQWQYRASRSILSPSNPRELAKLWRDLSPGDREGLLSQQEKDLLGRARQYVAAEFSLALQAQPDQLTNLLDELLISTADQPSAPGANKAKAKRGRGRR